MNLIIDIHSGEKLISTLEYTNTFAPSDVIDDICGIALPALNALGGSDHEVRITGEMSIGEEVNRLRVILNAAELSSLDGDKSLRNKIKVFIQAFRMWLIVIGNPKHCESKVV